MVKCLPLLKTLFTLVFLWVATFQISHPAFAQLSKEERKFWKKEMKKLTPEGMKLFMEERQRLTTTIKIFDNESNRLKSQTFEQDQQIAYLESQLQAYRERLKTREIQLGLINENGEKWDKGVVFKVQIGALANMDFVGEEERSFTLEVEKSKNYKQYVIGYFRDYQEANLLKKQMRKVGMNKAWIVPYKDGKRVLLKDVLDSVAAQ